MQAVTTTSKRPEIRIEPKRPSRGNRLTELIRSHWTAIALVGAFIVGAVIRCMFVGVQSLWYDEVYTYNIVTQSSLSDMLREVRATESTPPLFYSLTWLIVKAVGHSSDPNIRFVSVAAGIAIIPTAYFALRRFVGTSAALATAWLCAVSPLMFWYSVDGRCYALLILLGLLSLWSVALVCEAPTQRRFALWAFIGAACVYTHYFSIFLLVAEFLVLAWSLRKTYLIRLFAWGVGLAALSAPLTPMLLSQNDGRSSFILNIPWIYRLRSFVVQFPLGGPLGSPFSPTLRSLALWLSVFGLVVGLWCIFGPKFDVSKRARQLVAICLITFTIPLILNVVELDQHFFFRNLLLVWPFVAAIVVFGLMRFKALGLVAYIAVLAVASSLILFDWRYDRPDWRQASEVIAPLARNTPIFIYSGNDVIVAGHYLKRKPERRRPIAVVTDRMWMMIEPWQIDGALRQRLGFPVKVPEGFTLKRSLQTEHGFRLLEYTAPRRITVVAQELGADGNRSYPRLLSTTPVS